MFIKCREDLVITNFPLSSELYFVGVATPLLVTDKTQLDCHWPLGSLGVVREKLFPEGVHWGAKCVRVCGWVVGGGGGAAARSCLRACCGSP
jgi:hypothetical protein